MKRIQPLFLLIILAVASSSCSKPTSCRGDDKNNGAIIRYYRMQDFPMCMETFVNEKGTMVIRTSQELSAIVDTSCINLPGAGYSDEPPQIDFTEYSLLGFWATGGGCDIKMIREVNIDNNAKKYEYKIKVIECGSCDMLRYDANLVLVPKLPEDYSMNFLLDN
jgi:hypothetical protein